MNGVIKNVSVSTLTKPEIKEDGTEIKEDGRLNTWIYSIPVAVLAVGVVIMVRRLLSGGGEDEFEWE